MLAQTRGNVAMIVMLFVFVLYPLGFVSSLFSRCARVLLSLAESHGTLTPEGTLLNLAISQEELGEMLGCARQSVNKELGRLEEMGAISLHSRARYLIRDMELLRRIALLDLRAGASA